eukprot:g41681.t1
MTIPGSGGLEVKASPYMDDVAIFCLDPLSVCRLMNICDQFELASGAKGHHVQNSGEWGGENIPNIALILMTTFVYTCIKLCVDPWYTNTKCYYVLRLYLSCCCIGWDWPHGRGKLQVVEPFRITCPLSRNLQRKTIFDHQSIRKWSACSVLETLKEKERLNPVAWFSEQTVKVIWQNASSLELSNKHQGIAWLMERRALSVISFMYTSLHQHMLTSKQLQGSTLRSTLPGMHTETNINNAWRIINSVKGAPWSARNMLVCQNKELTVTESCRLANSKVQDYMLRDALKLGCPMLKLKD